MVPWDERAHLISRIADALEVHEPILREWLIKESGKPATTAAMETSMAVALLRGFASMKLEHEVVEDSDDRRAYVRYVPLGVGVGIVPWNWPLVLAVGKIGPALLTGNTLIIKPSPYTPYVGLKIAELASTILPPGVLQALSGGEGKSPILKG